jgi:uncharacterized delta-60 repeat protein
MVRLKISPIWVLLLLYCGLLQACKIDDAVQGSIDLANSNNYWRKRLGGIVLSIAEQSDGKRLIAGKFQQFDYTANSRIARANIDGSEDPNFKTGSGFNADVNAIARLPNDKILVAGNFTKFNGVSINRIARINIDGTLDTEFAPNTGANAVIFSMNLLPNNKILIAGNFSTYDGIARTRIARLNFDGTLDTSFDPGVGPNNIIYSFAVQPDGKIIIAGNFTTVDGIARSKIARLNSDGSHDTTFDPGNGAAGSLNIVYALALQQDDKIVIGGAFTSYNGTARNSIARVNSDGTLDTTFDPGAGTFNTIYSIAIEPNAKILAGGDFSVFNSVAKNKLVRLNSDGSIDASLTLSSTIRFTIKVILPKPNGKILIGGGANVNNTKVAGLTLINSDGSIDTNFNTGTGPSNDINTICVQSNGKILFGGLFTAFDGERINRIARFNADDTLDTSFASGTGADQIIYTVNLQSDNKIVISGDFTSYNGTTRRRVARLNSDGSIDTSFDPGTSANGTILDSIVQPDGKIIIAGIFSTYAGVSRSSIARVNVDGSLDTGFDPGTGAGGFFDTINSIALQSDGKIIIGGMFTSFNGTNRGRVARLNADGSLDTGFDSSTGAPSTVYAVQVQSDGKILIGGDFLSYNGVNRNRFARINTDGSIDAAFAPVTVPLSSVNGLLKTIFVQSNGQILIGGNFISYDGTLRESVARINSDGTLDTTFNANFTSSSVNFIEALYETSDNKVLIGGDFTDYENSSLNFYHTVSP